MKQSRFTPLGLWFKRYYIGIVLGLLLVVGLGLSWNWLSASGLLFGVLAGLGCLAMRGLGLFCGQQKDAGDD